ncbi:MAG: nitroreductase family protein [Acidimicrobiia bacterium]
MEFSEVLARRRMVRNYSSEPVDAGTLSRVASAAFRAPSAGNAQGLAIVVVTDQERRKAIAGLADEPAYVAAGFDPWISRAPAHVVISVSEQVYHDRYRESDKLDDSGEEIAWPVPYWWVDAGAAMMAVLLAAVDEGLAAGFLGVHSIPDLQTLLEIPDHFHPIGLITVGVPAPDRRSKSLDRGQRPLHETLHFETYTAP